GPGAPGGRAPRGGERLQGAGVSRVAAAPAGGAESRRGDRADEAEHATLRQAAVDLVPAGGRVRLVRRRPLRPGPFRKAPAVRRPGARAGTRDVLTLANQLTIFRMVMIPLLITLLLGNLHGWALAVFVLAGVTDALDG